MGFDCGILVKDFSLLGARSPVPWGLACQRRARLQLGIGVGDGSCCAGLSLKKTRYSVDSNTRTLALFDQIPD